MADGDSPAATEAAHSRSIKPSETPRYTPNGNIMKL